ncbi:MAG: rhodanese-like domain-containing protein [Nitrospirae bacterium]|nr:rhodanese-like domain-containing protein [Nitrospirota bacterium]
MRTISLFLLGLLMLVSSAAAAETFKTVTADELKKMIDSGKQITVVDTRTEEEFRQGHLPKAVNIPPEKVNNIGDLLPKAKNRPVVFYCRGVG